VGFEIRNEKNWHDVLVVSPALYGMEISIADFYPSDDKYPMLRSKEAHQVDQIQITFFQRPCPMLALQDCINISP
jgi:hypothetical protein